MKFLSFSILLICFVGSLYAQEGEKNYYYYYVIKQNHARATAFSHVLYIVLEIVNFLVLVYFFTETDQNRVKKKTCQ